MYQYEIIRGGVSDLDLISTLWEKLNCLHGELAPDFKMRFKEMNWSRRKQNLIEKSGEIMLEYVLNNKNKIIIGYCISTIDKENPETGEIDSIFIEEDYRKLGIGRKLICNAIEWLNTHNVKTQKLLVAAGNEKVIDFYRQFGFSPLHIVLQRKE